MISCYFGSLLTSLTRPGSAGIGPIGDRWPTILFSAALEQKDIKSVCSIRKTPLEMIFIDVEG